MSVIHVSVWQAWVTCVHLTTEVTTLNDGACDTLVKDIVCRHHEGHGDGSPFWLKTEPKAAFCLPTHPLLAIPSNTHLDRLVSRGVAVSIFGWKAQLSQPHIRSRCDWRRATLHLLSPPGKLQAARARSAVVHSVLGGVSCYQVDRTRT